MSAVGLPLFCRSSVSFLRLFLLLVGISGREIHAENLSDDAGSLHGLSAFRKSSEIHCLVLAQGGHGPALANGAYGDKAHFWALLLGQ
jgi:hypothetical protein